MSDELSPETAALLRGAEQGDAGAVNRLLERHRGALRRMVQVRMDPALARRVDASDVVQDALVEAHRRLREYLADARMPFHLWLRQIAKDRLIDTHRRHRVAQRRSLDREQPLEAPSAADRSAFDLAAQLAAHELSPSEQIVREELHQRFLAALDQLGEADREVMLMRHVEQLTNAEVAELLGVAPPAAAMRYLRATRRLRSILGGEAAETDFA